MNTKSVLFLIFLAVSILIPTGTNSQEDQLLEGCKTSIKSPFVMGDRSMKAFLTGEEVAEFRATLFTGNTYRIVSCSYEPNLIEFSLYDINRNLLFSSSDFKDVNLWNFKMEGSMECIIQARLKTETASSGMALLLMGFRQSDQP